MFINKNNVGFFEKSETLNFIKDIGKKSDLETRLKSLSSSDREFIKVACKIAEECQKNPKKDGKWTALVPWSDYRMLMDGLSTSNIGDRFQEISKKIDSAPATKNRSNGLVRVLKGLGNTFGRISAASLTNKIKKLNL